MRVPQEEPVFFIKKLNKKSEKYELDTVNVVPCRPIKCPNWFKFLEYGSVRSQIMGRLGFRFFSSSQPKFGLTSFSPPLDSPANYSNKLASRTRNNGRSMNFSSDGHM